MPSVKCRQWGNSPRAHMSQGGSIPRGTQPSHGFSTTRAPVSSRWATASWPRMWGKLISAVSGFDRLPWRNTCLESDPQIPVTAVRHVTQSGPGGSGSGASSRRTGAKPATKARGVT